MAKKQPKKQPKQQPTVADKNITGLEGTLGAEFHDILEELGKLSTELEKACSRVSNRSNAGTVEYTEIDDIMAKIPIEIRVKLTYIVKGGDCDGRILLGML